MVDHSTRRPRRTQLCVLAKLIEQRVSSVYVVPYLPVFRCNFLLLNHDVQNALDLLHRTCGQSLHCAAST